MSVYDAEMYVGGHVYNDTEKGVSVSDQVKAAFLAGYSLATHVAERAVSMGETGK